MRRIFGARTPVHKMLTMSALGLVLASQASMAQNANQNQQNDSGKLGTPGKLGTEVGWELNFNEVDMNTNNAAEWTELNAAYNRQLEDAGWDQEEVFSRFDRNNDDVLDEPEYVFFITGLEDTQRTAATGGQQGQQQQSQNQVAQQNQRNQANQQQTNQQQTNQQQDTVVLQEEEREELQPNVAGLRDQSDPEMQQTQQDAVAQQNQRNQQTQERQQDQMAQNMQGQQSQQGQQNQQALNPQGQQSPQGGVVTLVAVTTVQEVPIADIEDRQVVNLQGQEIGEVEDVVVSEDGNETGLVVGVGGFWDIGDKDIYVDLDDVNMRADQVVWETMVGEEELQELPEYNEKDYVSVR